MTRRGIRIGAGLLGALGWLAVTAPQARALAPPTAERWPCVHPWTAESLAHGPAAIANGAVLPFRNLASGLTAGWPEALWAPFSMLLGTVQGMGVIALGGFETLTGGAFAVVPPNFAHLNAGPMVQLPEARRDYAYEEYACPALGTAESAEAPDPPSDPRWDEPGGEGRSD